MLLREVVAKDDGTYQVFGVFQNQQRISVQDRSRTHLGAMVLDVIGDPASPSEVKGQYWTDRGTSGEIHVNEFDDGRGNAGPARGWMMGADEIVL